MQPFDFIHTILPYYIDSTHLNHFSVPFMVLMVFDFKVKENEIAHLADCDPYTVVTH